MVVLLWSQDFSLLLVGKSRLPLQVEIIDERKGLLEQSLFDASGFLAPVELTEAEYRSMSKFQARSLRSRHEWLPLSRQPVRLWYIQTF